MVASPTAFYFQEVQTNKKFNDWKKNALNRMKNLTTEK